MDGRTDGRSNCLFAMGFRFWDRIWIGSMLIHPPVNQPAGRRQRRLIDNRRHPPATQSLIIPTSRPPPPSSPRVCVPTHCHCHWHWHWHWHCSRTHHNHDQSSANEVAEVLIHPSIPPPSVAVAAASARSLWLGIIYTANNRSMCTSPSLLFYTTHLYLPT